MTVKCIVFCSCLVCPMKEWPPSAGWCSHTVQSHPYAPQQSSPWLAYKTQIWNHNVLTPNFFNVHLLLDNLLSLNCLLSFVSFLEFSTLPFQDFHISFFSNFWIILYFAIHFSGIAWRLLVACSYLKSRSRQE